jgi:chloramphenicol 3-O-phosphotransferase
VSVVVIPNAAKIGDARLARSSKIWIVGIMMEFEVISKRKNCRRDKQEEKRYSTSA